MDKVCSIIPDVTVQGDKSILLKQFLNFLERDEAVSLYKRVHNKNFVQTVWPYLKKDQFGEPLFEELFLKCGLNEDISVEQIIGFLYSKSNEYNQKEKRPKMYLHTDAEYKKLIKKAQKLNAENPYSKLVKARVREQVENDRTYFVIKYIPENLQMKIEDNSKEMEYNKALNTRLRELCSELGLSIDNLTQLEEELQIYSGVADFSTARITADGLYHIIRIAKGIKGEQALPEEFAHTIWRAFSNESLKNRLLNLLSEDVIKDILGDQYEKYSEFYESDFIRLQEEAAGKLIAKHFLNQETISNEKPYKNILQRIIDFIKKLWSSKDETKIQKAIIEADKEFGIFAQNILKGNYNNQINLSNITKKDSLYQISVEADKKKQALKEIRDIEIQRHNIYSARTNNERFDLHSKKILAEIERALDENDELKGILDYVTDTSKQIIDLHQSLNSLNYKTNIAPNYKAATLRSIKDFCNSYMKVTDMLLSLSQQDSELQQQFNNLGITDYLYHIESGLNRLNRDFIAVAMQEYVEFLKPYVGEGIKIQHGKFAGKTLVVSTENQKNMDKDTINIARFALEDISFFDLWLDSASDSSSYIIKFLDQAIKKTHNKARMRTIEMSKTIDAFLIKYEKLGITDYDFAFSKTEGKRNGKYVGKYDRTKYYTHRDHMLKQLQAKYGENPTGADLAAYRAEKDQWYRKNTIKVGDRTIPNSNYYSDEYANLSDLQKQFLSEFLDLKNKIEESLPEHKRNLLRNIMIRKDLFERVKNDPSHIGKHTWEAVKDAFISRSDDIDLVSKKALKDFQGREVNTLPIYYTHIGNNEFYEDISTDIGSTLTAYAAMAFDYEEMSKVVDILELSRDMLELYEVQQTKGGKGLVTTFKSGDEIIEQPIVQVGNATNIKKRIDSLYEMQVYKKYMKDEGNFGDTNISKAKTVDSLNAITAINNLAFNLLSDISNIATGNVMRRIESAGSRFYSQKSVRKADSIYASAMTAFMAESGKRFKTSKLFLWDEYFDVLQDYDKNIAHKKLNRRSRLLQLSSENPGYIIRHAGEHWLQNRTSLALAVEYTLKDSEGNEYNLWDAMEVKYLNEDGTFTDTDMGYGAKLVLKEGLVKQDDIPFTEEDAYKFMRKTSKINQYMDGIYNKADMNAVQQLSLGRMAMMYRKYLKPALNRRFSAYTKDLDLDADFEGYYNTSWQFLKLLAKDIRDSQWQLAVRWNNLEDWQKSNIKQAIKEMEIFLLILGSMLLLDFKDAGDKDNPWALRLLNYSVRRLYTEVGALTPTPALVTESLKIMKSPAAAINTMEDMVALIGCLNPFNWVGKEAEIQSGRFEGKTRGYRLIINSPLVPTARTWNRVLHPEEAAKYFNQN